MAFVKRFGNFKERKRKIFPAPQNSGVRPRFLNLKRVKKDSLGPPGEAKSKPARRASRCFAEISAELPSIFYKFKNAARIGRRRIDYYPNNFF